jgi:hypothetical protein
MNDFMQKVQILARVETAIFKINLQTAARQTILYAIAIVAILLTIAMLNVGVYMALSERFGKDGGALIVSGINGLLALILIVAANRTRPGAEAVMAKEIRNLAVAEIENDVDKVRREYDEFKSDLQGIRNGFSLVTSGKGTAMLGLMNFAPLLDLLISSLRKSK